MIASDYRCLSCEKPVVVSGKASCVWEVQKEMCADCYRNRRQRFANRMIAGDGLPELKGASQAQIDYANSVRAQVMTKLFVPSQYDEFGRDKLPQLQNYKFEKEFDPNLYSRVAYMNCAQWWLNLLSDTPEKKQKDEKLSTRLHETCSNDKIVGKVPQIDFGALDEVLWDWDRIDLESPLSD